MEQSLYVPLFTARNLSGPEYVRLVLDAVEQLVGDAHTSSRVLALPVHPFIVNLPSRHRYLAQILEQVRGRDEIWITAGDEIAAHYLEHSDAEARRLSQRTAAAA